MNPYKPPESIKSKNINYKTFVFYLIGLLVMSQVVFLYLLIVGALVRWLA
jgi:hypothetical protein